MVRKLRARSWYERVLLVEATVALATMWLAVQLVPFRLIIRAIGLSQMTSVECSDEPVSAKAVQIGRAVQSAATRVPWGGTCLVQALAGAAILRLNGLTPTLSLGVTRDAPAGTSVLAHAWLRCGEVMVTGQVEQHRYKQIATFTAAGGERAVS